MILSLIAQVRTLINLSNFCVIISDNKSKRFVFNRMRLFYFKEKLTTSLRYGGRTIKKHVSVKKIIYNDIFA